MSKKLLSEMQVRRFARLANLSPINEMDYKRDEEEKVDELNAMGDDKRDDESLAEAEEPEMEMGAEEPEMDMPEEEPELADLEGEEMELTDEEAQAIIDLGKKLEAAMGEGGMEEPEMEMPAEEPPAEMGMDAEEPEEEIMEALSGINYIPEKKEIVEEVARRVAKRLLKAKRAEKNLQEALGKRKTKQTRSSK